jgi:PiT family inorganic phosphate transporter
MVHESIWIIVLLILLAVAFDFMNGFHYAANSIATIVSMGSSTQSGRSVCCFF